MKWRLVLSVVALAVLGFSTRASVAQEMPVPAELQAAIFQRVFTMNQTLAQRGDVSVVVVYSQAGSEKGVVDAFKAAGIKVTATTAAGLAGVIDQAGVVYFMPGTEGASEVSRQKKVLSITGVPQVAETGKAAIGLGIEDGRPRIIVNIARLRAEDQNVSADLMRLAKVIQ